MEHMQTGEPRVKTATDVVSGDRSRLAAMLFPASVSQNQSRWNSKAGTLAFQDRHYAIVETARIAPDMRVLDVATGRGEVAVLAALAGAVVHAADIGPALAKAARRNATQAGVTISTGVADMRDLAGLPADFDLVLGCAALHHLDKDGVRRAVAAAVRVLVPGGRALFLEPIENVPWFDFLQNCFPTPNDRPSILHRRAWRAWLATRDDRAMSDAELLSAGPNARIVARFGLLARIRRTPLIARVDAWLLRWPPLHRFAQVAIVEYQAPT